MSKEEAVRLMQPPPLIVTAASTFIIGAVAGWVWTPSTDKYTTAISNPRAELGWTTDRLEHLETAVKALRSEVKEVRGEVKEVKKGIHEAKEETLESRRAARR